MTQSGRRTSDTQYRRTLTLEEIRKMGEEQRQVKATTFHQQGPWIKWEEFAKGKSQ